MLSFEKGKEYTIGDITNFAERDGLEYVNGKGMISLFDEDTRIADFVEIEESGLFMLEFFNEMRHNN